MSTFAELVKSLGVSLGCDESLTGNGEDYRGCQSMTRSGLKCRKWGETSLVRRTGLPDFYFNFKPKSNPNDGLDKYTTIDGSEESDFTISPYSGRITGHNYCRNPGGKNPSGTSDGLWCYTEEVTYDTDPWEYCDPDPAESATSISQADYVALEEAYNALIAARAEVDTLKSEKQSLTNDLETCDSEKRKLSDEKEKLTSELSKCESTKSDLMAEKKAAVDDFTTCSKDLGTCTDDLSSCESQKNTLSSEKETAVAHFEECHTQLNALTADKETLTADLETCNSQKSAVFEDMATCSLEKNTLSGDLATCNSDKDALQKDLEEANEALEMCLGPSDQSDNMMVRRLAGFMTSN